MRKQWSCSKCGFACKSTWRNLSSICNACKSKEGNRKANLDDPKRVKQSEAKVNNPLKGNSSLTGHEISPSSSIPHENVAFSVGQIGMVFGNLTLEPTLAIPVIIGGKSLEPGVKSEVTTADIGDCVAQVQKSLNLKPSTASTTGVSRIQIKQEYESEQTTEAEEEPILWDSNKVQKKKRSKLPQYTLWPLARFINQLQHVSCHRRHVRAKSAAVGACPKYDDVLIYEKCRLYVAENEIGLGAELLVSPPVYDPLMAKTTSFAESSSTS